MRILGEKPRPLRTILYYHSVTRENQGRFAKQMEDLNRLARSTTGHKNEILWDGIPHAGVTFDDGFQSVLENAIPELVKRKIPAILFIPTGYMGKTSEWTGKEGDGGGTERVMTEDQIKGLPADLVTVGSHAVTHTPLSRMNEEAVRRELIESKEILERVTGRSVIMLSLPYGMYDERTIKIAHEVGYQQVFSSDYRPIGKKGDVIERIPAWSSDWSLEFRLKVLGAYRWLPFILGLKRKLSVRYGSRTMG